MNKIFSAMKHLKHGTFHDAVNRKIYSRLLSNNSTLNLALQDAAYEYLSKNYSDTLYQIKEKVDRNQTNQEYSDKVWIFWRQGLDNAPNIVKACYQSVQKHLNDREILFLDQKNMSDYIHLPENIVNLKSEEVIPEAQYSDIIRIALLAEYGGMWVDSTVFCTGLFLAERIKKLPLFVFKNISLDRTSEPPTVCSNWLISAYSNNPFIITIRELMYTYWEREKSLKNYFIFHLFVHMVKDAFPELWENIPTYNNVSPHILQFEMLDDYDADRFNEIKKMSDFHKLNHHIATTVTGDISHTFLGHIIDGKIQ